MIAATDSVAILRRDPLRHITPLKMLGLYGDAMRAIALPAPDALILIAPRAVSQYDQTHYGEVQWVAYPALPAEARAALVGMCADAILAATGGAPLVLKTIEPALVAALHDRLGGRRAPVYRRALCTFGRSDGGMARAPSDVTVTPVVPDDAWPLLRTHGVYADAELAALLADGSARCHVRRVAGEALGVLLTFANAPAIHEIGSLHVRADVRRAGHARALLASALADLHARGLNARYVVDATNEASIALAKAAGLSECFRLAHWVIQAG